MKREIKFRGKVVKGFNEDFFKQQFVYGSAIISPTDSSSTIINREFEAEVDTDTIGQFTGLHDKNGKEIYESDIVKTPAGIGVIKWDKCFRIFWNELDSTTFHDTRTQHIEIIGNVFENPELIK